MAFPAHDALALLALLAMGAVLLGVAPRLRVPYPILLVLGGVAVGFLPGIPHVALRPEVVLVAVLPPLLYSAAFFTSLRDLRANARPLSLLALGLVLATMVAVAVACHEGISGLSWPTCFVIGAVVAPTDAVAATAIASRLGIPRRLVAIIEGESLINDATALVAYSFAVTAVMTGNFSLWHAAWRFVVDVAGGVAIGLAVGFVLRQIRRRLDHSPTEIAIALLSGYFAYLPAEAAGVSAVLAVVTVGVYVGWYTPELTTVQTRLQGDAVWEILVFLLNALLFGLVGLQLQPIIESLSGLSTTTLMKDAVIISAAVVLTRLIWIYPATYVPRLLFPRIREGPVSAVAVPDGDRLVRAARRGLACRGARASADDRCRCAVPARDLVIYLAFVVILATLVLQGLTLPLLIRLLGLEEDGIAAKEEVKARIHAAEAALGRLEELAAEDWVREDTAERLRGLYRFRQSRFAARFDENDDGELEQRSQNYQRLRRELLDAERRAVVELRRQGRINDEIMNLVQRDLDLEDARLDV